MSDIFSYYQNYDESIRLTRDRLHQTEYRIMMHLLNKYIGNTPLKILDCCAGCGAYSFPLATIGHEVTAGDLIPEHVAYMRDHNNGLYEIYEGNVCDLSRFQNDTFDVVLNFGAMYHLQDHSDRQKAISECIRVLKPGGLFSYAYQTAFAMVMGQYCACLQASTAESRKDCFRALDITVQTNQRDIFYGMTSDEIANIAAQHNLRTLCNACTYSVFYPFFREIDSYSEQELEQYVQMLLSTCEDEFVAKYGMHGVYFGQKSV